MEKVIHWGILGLGKIARKFAEGLKSVKNAKLIAVASRKQETADAFAKDFDTKYAHDNYLALAQNPEVDVIYIATPHVYHYENTLMCLENGKAVLCEKPFAMNLEQVQEMTDIALDKRVFLMEAFWMKFLPTFQKVQRLIAEGVIGEIKSIHADFGFKAPYEPEGRLFNKHLGGGSLLDVGIYPLFLATTLLGKPDSLKAFANIGQTDVDENCGMLLKYNKGQMAVLSSSIVSQTAIEANIYGEQGRIKLNSPFFMPTSEIEIIRGINDVEKIPVSYESNGYNYEAEEVTQCLLSGKTESKIMSLQDSLFLMEMLDWVRNEAGITYF